MRDDGIGGSGGADDSDNRTAVDRSVVLQNLGYHVLVRYPPIMKSSDMVGSEYLRKYLSDNVGDHVPDLIQLHAYTLMGYDAVALVDYDMLIVSPVDRVVDLIVDCGR